MNINKEMNLHEYSGQVMDIRPEYSICTSYIKSGRPEGYGIVN